MTYNINKEFHLSKSRIDVIGLSFRKIHTQQTYFLSFGIGMFRKWKYRKVRTGQESDQRRFRGLESDTDQMQFECNAISIDDLVD